MRSEIEEPFDGRMRGRTRRRKREHKPIQRSIHGLYSRFHHLARRCASHADVERFLVILVLFVATSRERELRKIPGRTQ